MGVYCLKGLYRVQLLEQHVQICCLCWYPARLGACILAQAAFSRAVVCTG